MYTGDDFNYAELIAGDDAGPFDALLGIFDAIAPGRLGGARGARARQRQRVLRAARADRAAEPPHLRGADALLQDRRGVPRLSQRPAGPFHHDRRPAERPARCSTSPNCSASPTRPACWPTRTLAVDRMKRGAGGAMECRHEPARHLDEPRHPAQRLELRRDGRWLPAARRHRHLALARPGRGRRPRRSGAHRRVQRPAGHRALPRRHVPGRRPPRAGRRNIDDNLRAIDEAAALGADCLVLVVGGLPRHAKDIAGARQMVADGIAAMLPHARAAACRSPSSRCIRCMRPTGPA